MKHLFPDAFVSPTGESFADAVPIPIFGRKQPPLGAGAVNPQNGLDKSLAFPFLTVKDGEKVYHCGVDVQRINPPTWTTLPPPFTEELVGVDRYPIPLVKAITASGLVFFRLAMYAGFSVWL